MTRPSFDAILEIEGYFAWEAAWDAWLATPDGHSEHLAARTEGDAAWLAWLALLEVREAAIVAESDYYYDE